MEKRMPLVYLRGLAPGRYLTAWPVYIEGDDPASFTFKVAVDSATVGLMGDQPLVAEANVRQSSPLAACTLSIICRCFPGPRGRG